MASRVPNGLRSVAMNPGYSVDIKLGYYSSTTFRTISKTVSTLRAKMCRYL